MTNLRGIPAIGSAQIWAECENKGSLPAVNTEVVIPQIAGLVVYRMQTGDDVRALQQALTDAGYACGAIDGALDKQTAAAIRDFQAANGLTFGGKAGRQTVTTLGGTWTGK